MKQLLNINKASAAGLVTVILSLQGAEIPEGFDLTAVDIPWGQALLIAFVVWLVPNFEKPKKEEPEE